MIPKSVFPIQTPLSSFKPIYLTSRRHIWITQTVENRTITSPSPSCYPASCLLLNHATYTPASQPLRFCSFSPVMFLPCYPHVLFLQCMQIISSRAFLTKLYKFVIPITLYFNPIFLHRTYHFLIFSIYLFIALILPIFASFVCYLINSA